MSIIRVNGPPDRARGLLDGVSYDLENKVFLTPDNLLARDGDPRRVDAGLPEYEDGIVVYGGLSPQNMVRQNNHLLPLKRATYNWAIYEEDGHPPTTERDDSGIPVGPKPGMRDVSANTSGYKAALYRLFYSGVDNVGRHTRLSPYNTALVQTDGQNIRFPFPQQIPANWPKVGVWLSEPDGTIAWLQQVVDLSKGRPVALDLVGPFRYLRKAPTVNETYLGVARTPSVAKKSSTFDLLDGEYAFYATDLTEYGESLPSAMTAPRSFATVQKKSRLEVAPGARRTGALGWRCYAAQKDGRTYVLFPPDGNPERPLEYATEARAHSTDPSSWPPNWWRVEQRDLPVTDTSGLSDPIDPPDDPMVYGGQGLHSGSVSRTYHSALALVKNGVEGPRGPTNSRTITGSRAINVGIPKSVNRLRNPDQTEIGSDQSTLR